MAHYALLDENNVVVQVITGRDEDDLPEGVTDWEVYYGNFHGQTCKRTSYNTVGNQHLLGGTPFRGNYGSFGSTYDETRDAFIPPQPHQSWVLNETTLLWDAPVALPDDAWDIETGTGIRYYWDEATTSWVAPDPRPFPSWVLNEATQLWEPPVAPPDDAWSPDNESGVKYRWDEVTNNWIEAES
jgi:hypothetical protein